MGKNKNRPPQPAPAHKPPAPEGAPIDATPGTPPEPATELQEVQVTPAACGCDPLAGQACAACPPDVPKLENVLPPPLEATAGYVHVSFVEEVEVRFDVDPLSTPGGRLRARAAELEAEVESLEREEAAAKARHTELQAIADAAVVAAKAALGQTKVYRGRIVQGARTAADLRAKATRMEA